MKIQSKEPNNGKIERNRKRPWREREREREREAKTRRQTKEKCKEIFECVIWSVWER